MLKSKRKFTGAKKNRNCRATAYLESVHTDSPFINKLLA